MFICPAVTVPGNTDARSSGATPRDPARPLTAALGAYAASMAKIVVDVMLKAEIRDPQGEAIVGAARRLGFTDVRSVRQGKRFEVEIDDSDDPEARTAELAAELLANPVIEEFALSRA